MAVIGVAGNSPLWREMETGEYLRKLQGRTGRVIYNEMRRSEPQIKAVLRALSLPIIGADFFIEPASDEGQDQEISDFVSEALFRKMSITWKDFLRHVELKNSFGFSPFEKVFVKREDGKIGIHKLDPRLPQSIVEWDFDRDKHRLKFMIQEDTDGKRFDIPIEKLVVFTNNREGDNWEGVSELRAAYKPWKIKNDLEKLQAIAFERYGVGFPLGTHPRDTKQGSPEHEALVDLLLSIQSNEEAYGTLPEGFDIKLLTDGLKGMPDMLSAIKYYDQMISRSVLAQWLDLGSTETGSRALGGSFIDVFLTSLQEDAEYICETLNRFVIRQLVDYNWDVEDYPVLKVGNIKELDLATIASLKGAGIITSDAELENSVRKILGLPEIDPEEREAARQLPPGLKPDDEDTEDEESKDDEEPPEDEEAEEDQETEDEEDDPKKKKHHDHEHRTGWQFADRELTKEESLSDIPTIQINLDASEGSVKEKLLAIAADQKKSIIIQAVGGKKIQNIAVPGKKDMHSILMAAYKENYERGADEVLSEVNRQASSAFSFADPPGQRTLFDIMDEEISMKVEGAADKLKTMIFSMYLDLRKEGIAGDELRSRLELKVGERITDATWAALASTAVNQGWGHGRKEALEKADDGVDYYYRSAILDGNACMICRPKDGRTVSPGEEDFIVPDPECEGTPARCRCMVIAVMKAESA